MTKRRQGLAKSSSVKEGSTAILKCARIAVESLLINKTLTGAAGHIKPTSVETYGGAAAREARTNLGVDFRNMLRKTMVKKRKMMSVEKETRRSNLNTLGANAASS